MRQKKPFLLLEILISICIITICLVPLVRSSVFTYQKELHRLEEMERQRLADATFLEIKESFLNQQIPWGSLPSPDTTTDSFSLQPTFIDLPNCAPKKVERRFYLSCSKLSQKEGFKGEIYKRIKVHVVLSPPMGRTKSYNYNLAVQKIPASPQPNQS